MRYLTTLNLLLLSAFSATAQLSFNEIVLNPGTASSKPHNMRAVNGTMYFQAERAGQGNELWATDGTASGTRFIKDLYSGPNSSNPHSFVGMNGKVYFLAKGANNTDDLWETDGTTTGTKVIFQSTINSAIGSTDLLVMNGKLYFSATTIAEGVEIWESDGTTAGTKLLKDINPGSGNGWFGNRVVYNNKIYFEASDGTSSTLWCTDGTTAGTIKVSTNPVSYICNMCVMNNMIYFTATDATGRVLYKSDGSNAGTVPVATLSTSTTIVPLTTEEVIVNNKLYFISAGNNNTQQIWATDGTATGTTKLKEISNTTSDAITNLTVYNGNAYFVIQNNNSAVLYNTDGITGNTKTANGFTANANTFTKITDLISHNGYLYFTAYSPYYLSNQLYAVNPDGELMNIKPAGNSVKNTMPNYSGYIYSFNNQLFVAAGYNSNEGFELWSIDGTPTGISNTAAKAAHTFTLYPNPATDILHIKTGNINKQVSIRISNQLGQTVLAEDMTGKNTISLQGIAPGIYTATIDADGVRETQQLTIQ